MTVLHQLMPHIAQADFVALTLLEDPHLIIGCRSMRFVAQLFTFEVLRRILAASFGRLTRAILGNKALHRHPGFNQPPIHREMLMRNQLLPLSQRNDLAEKLAHDIFGKGHGRPDTFIHQQASKPVVQQVVLNILYQLPFRTDRKQKLNQSLTQQPLCRNARAPWASTNWQMCHSSNREGRRPARAVCATDVLPESALPDSGSGTSHILPYPPFSSYSSKPDQDPVISLASAGQGL